MNKLALILLAIATITSATIHPKGYGTAAHADSSFASSSSSAAAAGGQYGANYAYGGADSSSDSKRKGWLSKSYKKLTGLFNDDDDSSSSHSNHGKKYGYGYGHGSSDSSLSSSSSSEDIEVRIPEGDYYICRPEGTFHKKQCLSYKGTEDSSVSSDSSSASGCNGKASSVSSESSDEYSEHKKFRYIYADLKYASKFSVRYQNETTTAFTLTCESCQNEFHGALVAIVKRHLELSTTESNEFRVYRHKKTTNVFKIKSTQNRWMSNWWYTSAIHRNIKLGSKRIRGHKFQLFKILNGPAQTFLPTPAAAQSPIAKPVVTAPIITEPLNIVEPVVSHV